MKQAAMIISMTIMFLHGSAHACTVLNEEKIQIGSRPGIKGICSNNRLPVTCLFREGVGIECDGPSGGYTGYDLQNLIFSACGCTTEQEKEKQMKKEFEKRVPPR